MESKFVYNNHIVTVILDDNSEITYDIDSLLKIDYSNIFAEIITFSVILNRFGILLADIDNAIREKDAELEREKADLKKKRALAEKKALKKLQETIKTPTISQIEGEVYQDAEHQIEEDKYRESVKAKFNILHDRDIVNSIYWSCKAKSNLLEKMSDKLHPIDMEQDLIDFQINNVLVKGSRKLVQTK